MAWSEEAAVFQHLSPGSKAYEKTKSEIISFVEKGVALQKATSHTEILPGLYVGSHKDVKYIVKKSPSLLSDLITARSFPKKPDTYTQRWKGIPIAEFPRSKINKFFDDSFEFIEHTETRILIQCNKGHSRSPTLVIAYLMKKFEISYSIAYKYVKLKRPYIRPNREFLNQLRKYETKLNNHANPVGNRQG